MKNNDTFTAATTTIQSTNNKKKATTENNNNNIRSNYVSGNASSKKRCMEDRDQKLTWNVIPPLV